MIAPVREPLPGPKILPGFGAPPVKLSLSPARNGHGMPKDDRMKETRSGKSADRPVVVWFRDDLRIADHPALHHAAEQGAPIIALYVHDEKTEGIRAKGAAQKWFLHHCLSALAAKLDGVTAIGGHDYDWRLNDVQR